MGCTTLLLYVVVLSCVVWRVFASEEGGNVTQPLDALEVGRKYSKKQLAAITKNFVNYYLHFGCKEGTSCGVDAYMCFPSSFRNVTHVLLASSLNTSASSQHSPRVLARNQVSWKPKGNSCY
jgi:hypothetical protein